MNSDKPKGGRPRRAPRLFLRKARPEKAMRAAWTIRFLGRELATSYGRDDRKAAKADLNYFKELLDEHDIEAACQIFRTRQPKGGRPQRAPRLVLRKARPEKGMRAKWVIRFQGYELATSYAKNDYAAAKADLDYFKGLLAEPQTSPEVGERSKTRDVYSACQAFRASRWGRCEIIFPTRNSAGNPE